MNTDDTIREILRAEADTVEPSAAGWDAITTGIAARRRKTRWVRSGALAGAVLTVVAVAVFALPDHDRQGLDNPPATTSPTPSATATVTPPPVLPDEPIGAIWPLTTTAEVRAWTEDHTTYPSLATPAGAALGFARTYVGIADASVAPGGGDTYVVSRPVNGTPRSITTLTVHGFGADGGAPYVVTLAASDSVDIAKPAAGATLASPLVAHGTYRQVDPSFTVSVRADSGATAPVVLATAKAVTGPPNVWDARIEFTTSARTGSVLVTNPSLADDGLADAAAVPVTFRANGTAAPDTFAAAREGSIVQISAVDGSVVGTLVDAQPGGGASDPDLTTDGSLVWVQGAGTCSTSIRLHAATGGPVTTLVPAGDATLSHPSFHNGVLAYVTSSCAGGTQRVVAGSRTIPVQGVVRDGPEVGEFRVTYVTVLPNGATTLYVMNPQGGNGDVALRPPAGCEWQAATWGVLDAQDRQQVYAAARCGAESRLYRMTDRTGPTLMGSLGSLDVLSLDLSADYFHLLLGVREAGNVQVAYRYEGGSVQRIDAVAERPTW